MRHPEYKNLLRLLSISRSSLSYARTDSDLESALKNQITLRDEHYTDLLSDYIVITRWRNNLKEFHKWIFFWGIFIASLVGIKLMYSIFKTVLANNDIYIIIDAIPILITSLVSFVATIIVVPRTIAEFLFNTHEEENITKIIMHTQEHDASGRGLFKGYFSKSKPSAEGDIHTFEKISND